MIRKAISQYLGYQYKKVDSFIKNPIRKQEEILKYLLKNGEDTFVGSKYRYRDISNMDEYRKRVPIFRYEDLYPYLKETILNKQQNLLWNKPIKWFAMSSGTTERRSKYIPLTRDSLFDNHYRCGRQMLALYANAHPDTRFLLGKTLILGGSKQINSIGEGIFTGDVSAILIKNLNCIAKTLRTPDSISLLPDWDEKLSALIQYGLKHDVRALMGVPSWMLVLLKRIEKETGRSISDIWPNLEVIFHGGVSFAPFEEQYHKLIANNVYYWETYNASEGFFGVQYAANSKDLLLMLDSGVYFEFAPMSEWNKPNPQTLTLDEVEIGENYAIIISTNGGLWRYMIGDTIRFTSKYPYLFRITGRTKNFINAFGEELTIDNAEMALSKACKQIGCSVTEFTVGPIYFTDNHSGAHEWHIEFAVEPICLDEFSQVLDKALKEYNSDYDAKRSYNLSLGGPVIKSLPKGTFNNWLKFQGKLGGQNKIPRLSNDREYINQLSEYIHTIG